MSCSNNLKQLALALHNYHDVHKTFPSLAQGTNQAAVPERDSNYGGLSGIVSMLPFMEQSALYDKIRTTSGSPRSLSRLGTGSVVWLELPPASCAGTHAALPFGRWWQIPYESLFVPRRYQLQLQRVAIIRSGNWAGDGSAARFVRSVQLREVW